MRGGKRSSVGRLAIVVATVGVTGVALSACVSTADAQNAVVSEPSPVAATSTPPSTNGPDSLAIAKQRLDALTAEQRDVAVQRSSVQDLITTLTESSSCKRESKSCEKKLAMLVGERARLEARIEQLPRAITATSARVSQLQAQSL